MGLTILFTHFKIILLQCFSVFSFSKISFIQTDPKPTTKETQIGLVFHQSGPPTHTCYSLKIFAEVSLEKKI